MEHHNVESLCNSMRRKMVQCYTDLTYYFRLATILYYHHHWLVPTWKMKVASDSQTVEYDLSGKPLNLFSWSTHQQSPDRYFIIVLIISETCSGESFLRINLATDITSLISPPFCHICEPINLLRPELSFGNTFSEIPRNWASVYLDKKSFLNLDCKGFDNRPSSLAVANTLQLFISKSYWRFIWSTLIRPLSKKLSSFSWNCFGILSNSSKRIILGLFSSRISSILLVVLLPSKKTVVMALFPSLWLLYI